MRKVNTLSKTFSKTASSQYRLIKDTVNSIKGDVAVNTWAGSLFKTNQMSTLRALKEDSKAWLKQAGNLQLKRRVWAAGGVAALGLGTVKVISALHEKGKNFNLKSTGSGKRGQDSAGMLGQASLEGLKFKPLKNRKYI